jgi:DNA-directed RNA polymerase specialized sigma24 family protein
MVLLETQPGTIRASDQFVTISVLPNERYLERDTSIRSFCTTLQSGVEPSPELTEQFEAGVSQIAARVALRMNCSGDRVDAVVEHVVFKLKEAILTGTFVPIPGTPVASYISKKAHWTVLSQRERDGVQNRHELHGDPEVWVSSHHQKPQNQTRPTEEHVIHHETLFELEASHQNNLSPEQQAVLELLPYYSIEEIAQQLSISYHDVVSRAYRARTKLREAFPDIAKHIRKHK